MFFLNNAYILPFLILRFNIEIQNIKYFITIDNPRKIIDSQS
jgi:hypothetical protein